MPRLRDGRAAGEVIVAKGRGPIPGGDELGAIQELRPHEKCCRKISAIQDGLEEVGAGEIGPGKVGVTELGAAQIGAREVGACEIVAAEIEAAQGAAGEVERLGSPYPPAIPDG